MWVGEGWWVCGLWVVGCRLGIILLLVRGPGEWSMIERDKYTISSRLCFENRKLLV